MSLRMFVLPPGITLRQESLKAKAKGDTATMDMFGLMGAGKPAEPQPDEHQVDTTGGPWRRWLNEMGSHYKPHGSENALYSGKPSRVSLDQLNEHAAQKRVARDFFEAAKLPTEGQRAAEAERLLQKHAAHEHGRVARGATPHPPTPGPPHGGNGDNSHGGRLHQEQRTDAHGHTQTRWVSAPDFSPQVHLAQHADDPARMQWHHVANAFEAVDDPRHVHDLAAHILRHRPDLEDDVVQASGEAVERLSRHVETEPGPESEGPPAAAPPELAQDPGPLSAPAEPSQRRRAERKPDPDKIVPVGEHVARARRDIAQENLANRDIAEMTTAERVKFVTRDNLVPSVTPEQAESMGKTPGWLEMRRAVVNAIGPSFTGGDDVAQRFGYSSAAAEYARMVDHVCKTLDRCSTARDVADAIEEMSEYAHGTTRLPQRYSDYGAAVEASRAAFAKAGIQGFEISTIRDGRDYAVGYYARAPADERDLQRRIFPMATLGEKFARMMHPWEAKRGPGWNGARTRAAKAERLGWDGLRKDAEEKAGTAKPVDGERERKHPWRTNVADTAERRGGKAVAKADPAQLAQDFGLSEVDFGNYATQDDRAYHVQRAHEALFDLADVLGVDPKHLSLGGMARRSSDETQPLAIAFGARGKGRAAAHYEPASVDVKGRPAPVINITKFNGGGSLAHEWGHFLDNMLARAHRGPGVSFSFDRWVSKGHTGTLPAPVVESLQGVMAAVRGPGELHRREHDRHMAAYRAAEQRGDTAAMREHPRAAGRASDEYGRARPTNFLRHAFALDGNKGTSKSYWATPHEMFARAFESYVQDKIEDSGRRSSYLADGTRDTYNWGKNVTDDRPNLDHPEVKATLAAREKAREAAATIRHDELTKLAEKHGAAIREERAAAGRTRVGQADAVEAYRRAMGEWKTHPRFAEWQRANEDAEAAGRAHEEAKAKHFYPAEPAQPYPQGEERKAINEAFDRFFDALRAHPEVYKAIAAHLAVPLTGLRLMRFARAPGGAS